MTHYQYTSDYRDGGIPQLVVTAQAGAGTSRAEVWTARYAEDPGNPGVLSSRTSYGYGSTETEAIIDLLRATRRTTTTI